MSAAKPRIITVSSHGHQYRRKVEYRYDPKRKRTVPHVLENLGPVTPIYRHANASPTPETFPCTLVQFGLLATHLLNGTLTAEIARDLIQGMGTELPPDTLSTVGIRIVMGKKTPTLDFLLWPSPPSTDPRPALSAKPA